MRKSCRFAKTTAHGVLPMQRWAALLSEEQYVRSNPFLWPKPPLIWGYGIAVLSVAGASGHFAAAGASFGICAVSAVSCAVMLSAWFGGLGQACSRLRFQFAFYYYFPAPDVFRSPQKPEEIRAWSFLQCQPCFGSLSAARKGCHRIAPAAARTT